MTHMIPLKCECASANTSTQPVSIAVDGEDECSHQYLLSVCLLAYLPNKRPLPSVGPTWSDDLLPLSLSRPRSVATAGCAQLLLHDEHDAFEHLPLPLEHFLERVRVAL